MSVVVPAYNAEDTVGRTIDTIERQLGPDDELLVCDDGSTDGTAEIVRTWDDATLLRNPENEGLTSTLNTLVDHASGDIILRVDADTRIERGVIDRVKEELTTGGEVAWVKIAPENTNRLHPAAALYGKQNGQATWFGGACHALRKETLLSLGGYRDGRTAAKTDGGGEMHDEMAALRERIWEAKLRERHITDVTAQSVFPTRWGEVLPRKWLSAQTAAEQFRADPDIGRLPALKGPLFWSAVTASWLLGAFYPLFGAAALVSFLVVFTRYYWGGREVAAISGNGAHAPLYPWYMALSGLVRTGGAWAAFLRGGR